MNSPNAQKGYLVLETGEIYAGLLARGEDRAGEVVFNASHSGYEEIATDPSYFTQIVVMTAPMQEITESEMTCGNRAACGSTDSYA